MDTTRLVAVKQMARRLSKQALQTNEPDFPQDELEIIKIETVGRSHRRSVDRKQRLVPSTAASAVQTVESIQLSNELIVGLPIKPLSPLQAGKDAVEQGDLEAALSIFQGMVERDPENANSWLELARTQYMLGENESSREAVAIAFKLRPTSDKANMLTAKLDIRDGNYAGARAALWRLVAKNLTEIAIMTEILEQFQLMEMDRDVKLVADAILEVDLTNAIALTAREQAISRLSETSEQA